jgi:hypothetical protein
MSIFGFDTADVNVAIRHVQQRKYFSKGPCYINAHIKDV